MKQTDKFIAQATLGDNKWWRYLLKIISIVTAFSLGNVPYLLFSYYKKERLGIDDKLFSEYLENMDISTLDISENTFFLLILLVFIPPFIVIVWLIPIIHKRPLISFISNRERFDKKRFFLGLSSWFLFALLLLFFLLDSDQYIYNFQPDKFIPLAIISILLVPIQTTVEEVLFRGYLMQGIYQLTNKKWLTLIIVSILFALAHVFNPEFENGFLTIIPAYLIFSFFMGYITLLDNGLEIPIGIHTGNNLFVALILSASGASITTSSIFKTDIQHLIDILPSLLLILSTLCFILLKFNYKWKLKL